MNPELSPPVSTMTLNINLFPLTSYTTNMTSFQDAPAHHKLGQPTKGGKAKGMEATVCRNWMNVFI